MRTARGGGRPDLGRMMSPRRHARRAGARPKVVSLLGVSNERGAPAGARPHPPFLPGLVGARPQPPLLPGAASPLDDPARGGRAAQPSLPPPPLPPIFLSPPLPAPRASALCPTARVPPSLGRGHGRRGRRGVGGGGSVRRCGGTPSGRWGGGRKGRRGGGGVPLCGRRGEWSWRWWPQGCVEGRGRRGKRGGGGVGGGGGEGEEVGEETTHLRELVCQLHQRAGTVCRVQG